METGVKQKLQYLGIIDYKKEFKNIDRNNTKLSEYEWELPILLDILHSSIESCIIAFNVISEALQLLNSGDKETVNEFKKDIVVIQNKKKAFNKLVEIMENKIKDNDYNNIQINSYVDTVRTMIKILDAIKEKKVVL